MKKYKFLEVGVISLSLLITFIMILINFISIWTYSGIIDEFSPVKDPFILIVLLPLIFILIIIGSRFCKKIKNKITYISLILMLAYILIFPLTLSVISGHLSEFDTNMWKEHPQIRHYMIENLEDTDQLKGMTKDEVITLLGYPNEQDQDNIFYYNVGISFPDYEAYYIKFEDNAVIDSGLRDF